LPAAIRITKRGNNMKKMQKDQTMLEEYDFSAGVQGRYSKRYRAVYCNFNAISLKSYYE
jgi:hypothetical protein